jgi:Na+/phosphate symporter
MALADFADPLAYAAVMTAGIALTHTGFNVMNTLLFLPFLEPYTRLLERIVPDPAVKEVARLKHLDARAVSAPVLGVEQSRGEVIKMGRQTVRMMEGIRAVVADGEPDQEGRPEGGSPGGGARQHAAGADLVPHRSPRR